jgi:hypothetical protein
MGTADPYVPNQVKGLIKECKMDEVAEVAGPFIEKRAKLFKEATGEDGGKSRTEIIKSVLGPGPEGLDRMAVMRSAERGQRT